MISFPVTTASAFSFYEIFDTFIHWNILFNSWKVWLRKFENSSLGSISRELGSDCLERHRRTCHATVNRKTKNYISSVPITENTIPLLQPLQWRFLSVKWTTPSMQARIMGSEMLRPSSQMMKCIMNFPKFPTNLTKRRILKFS